METRRFGGAAAALCLALAAGACLGQPPSARTAVTPPRPSAASAAPTPAKAVTYPVGRRVLHLSRGRSRPLPTLVYYPAGGRSTTAGGQSTTAGGRSTPGRATREPARGRFPLVLFSHGLSGSPERYAATLEAWAAAGFVVAAPTYPHTSEFTTAFRRRDIVNQPADARYVLDRVRRLNLIRGDPLWHRIDTDHMAAIGHSAGGYTTTGLFTAGHDPRLRAGVIMAGWVAPGAFTGPPAALLFIQGTADPIVPVAVSRATFARVPWPKSYLLLRHDSHATYLHPGNTGHARMASTVIDFLRWTLTGDEAARHRLPQWHG